MLPTVAPWGSYRRFGKERAIIPWGRLSLYDPPITVNFQQGIWNSGPGTQGSPFLFFILAAHQNLASKIFSLCCKCCEKPDAADDSKIPNQTQELQLSKHGRYQARMPCPASGDLILLIPLLLRCPQISFSF